MTYPPPGGNPDPYQPQQPPGQQPPEGQNPYQYSDPYATPSSGAPASGQPYAPPPGQAYGQPGQAYGQPGQAYGQPGQPYGLQPGQPYGQPGQYPPAYSTPRGTNAMAIISLVCSLAGLVTCISAPVGIVLGHIAKKQIRQTGEQGEGLATAGLVVGYILTVGGILACIGVVVAAIASDGGTY